MQALVATCNQIAASGIPILLCGETGTGKEVVARHIHENSPRRKQPMICVNCAALPKDLVESELFGAARGAYTGASNDRTGLIGAADGGTLFLDELSEMPLGAQSKLLRVLQERKVRRVGSTKEDAINFRLICAVSNLPEMLLEQKRLRPDLYYRIGAVTLFLPRLRNRRNDILPLAETFLNWYAKEQAVTEPVYLGKEAKEALLAYEWPGNVRQLENEIQRVLALGYRHSLPPDGFSPPVAQAALDKTAQEKAEQGHTLGPIELAERRLIIEAIQGCHGNIKHAAQRLRIGRQTLYNKIRQYSLADELNRTDRKRKSPADEPPAGEDEGSVEIPSQKEAGPVCQPPAETSPLG